MSLLELFGAIGQNSIDVATLFLQGNLSEDELQSIIGKEKIKLIKKFQNEQNEDPHGFLCAV